MPTRLGSTPRWPCPKCALPNARAVELASQTDGVSAFKWRDVRQHLDDLARAINLVLNADAHRP